MQTMHVVGGYMSKQPQGPQSQLPHPPSECFTGCYLAMPSHIKYQATNPATTATQVASMTWPVGCLNSALAI